MLHSYKHRKVTSSLHPVRSDRMGLLVVAILAVWLAVVLLAMSLAAPR